MTDYSTTDVARLSGASYRQLDYWDRTRVLSPSVAATGIGSQRRYTESELEDVQIIVALLAAGITLTAIRRLGPRRTAERVGAALEKLLAGAA